MSEDINDLIKPVISNGKAVNHRVTDPDLGLQDFRCSTYILKEKVLVKGESNNLYSRNLIIVFFDLLTGKVKGGTNFFCHKLTKRLWKSIQWIQSQFSRPL